MAGEPGGFLVAGILLWEGRVWVSGYELREVYRFGENTTKMFAKS